MNLYQFFGCCNDESAPESVNMGQLLVEINERTKTMSTMGQQIKDALAQAKQTADDEKLEVKGKLDEVLAKQADLEAKLAELVSNPDGITPDEGKAILEAVQGLGTSIEEISNDVAPTPEPTPTPTPVPPVESI